MGERSEDGELSLGETVCLGFCHSSPSFRDGDVDRRGPGRPRAGALGGGAEAAPEPEWRSVLDDPVLIRPGDFSGLQARARRALARRAAGGGEGGEPPRSRRRRLPGRAQVGVHGQEPCRREVHRRQRRRGRPRLLHRQAPDGVEPGAPARGHGHRRLRGRRRHGLRLRPLRVPALDARARAGRRARVRLRRPRRRHLRERLLLPRTRGGGRRFVRRRRRDGAPELAPGHARHGLGAAAFPGREGLPRAPDRRQQRRDPLQRPLHRAARRRGLRGAEPRCDAAGRS